MRNLEKQNQNQKVENKVPAGGLPEEEIRE